MMRNGSTLRSKLIWGVVVFSLYVTFLVGGYIPYRLHDDGQRWFVERSTATGNLVAQTLSSSLEFDDGASANKRLLHLEGIPSVRFALLYRQDGSALASYGTDRPSEETLQASLTEGVAYTGSLAVVTVPVKGVAGEPLGALVLGVSMDDLDREHRANLFLSLTVVLLVPLIGVALTVAGDNALIRPIRRVSRAARAVADGAVELERLRLDVRAEWRNSRDEVEQLTVAIVDMADRLADQMEYLDEERLRAEEAQNVALAASSAKSEFLANMSHELRTPLNAIIGYSELLMEEEPTTEAVDDSLPKIAAAGRHLLGLINDLLDISKIEAGRMEVSLEPCDLQAIVDDVQDTVAPLMERRSNALRCSLADDLTTVYADATRLRQILYNLLSNAGKFTESGAVRLSAERATRGGRQMVRFTVQDTGIGIPKSRHASIFKPFVQGDASTTRVYGGTGLGLAIVRSFVEMMDGTIDFRSVQGSGTTFVFDLPWRECDALFDRRASTSLPPNRRMRRTLEGLHS